MRKPNQLSHSSLALFEKDHDEFYLKYLSENRPGRLPQTLPMSVGSAFDARVKSSLHEAIFGKGADPVYQFEALFESQVEEQNRDFALQAGNYAFSAYRIAGAYVDLLKLLKKSIEPPRFECTLTGRIGNVPFIGKPDCRFVLDFGQGRISIVFDWKVKSFCSRHSASPGKGYMLCRDGYGTDDGRTSRSHNGSHPLFLAHDFRGLTINQGFIEQYSTEYADQCTLYGWLLGEPIGSEETLVFIDELICKSTGNAAAGEYPLIRVASHRARVCNGYQQKLFERVQNCWEAITSGHVFTDLTREASDSHIGHLEQVATGLATDGSSEETFYNTCTRPQYKR